MKYLLDTSVFSQPIKDHPVQAALERWSSLGEHEAWTSAVCLAELLQGLEARGSQRYWRRYRYLLENRYGIIPFEQRAAVKYSLICAHLKKTGQPRPALDLLVAATAVAHEAVLATLNVKDFRGIPDLEVEDWSS